MGGHSIGTIAKALDEGSWVSLRYLGHPLLHEAVSQAYYAGARCVLELAWADPRYRPLFESPDYLDYYGLTVVGRMAKTVPPAHYQETTSPSDVARVWIGFYAKAADLASTRVRRRESEPRLVEIGGRYAISVALLIWVTLAQPAESVWFSLFFGLVLARRVLW